MPTSAERERESSVALRKERPPASPVKYALIVMLASCTTSTLKSAAVVVLGQRTPSHEFGRTDGDMAHNAGGPGVSKEKHLRSGGFPSDVSAGWNGTVQTAGATQTRDGGQRKWTVEEKQTNKKPIV